MTLNQQPQISMHNPSIPTTSTIQQNLERQHQLQANQPSSISQPTEAQSFEQRLRQLREESSQIEVQMRTNNSQNNYQMPIQH